jgi:hypothetical protein
MLGGMEKKVRFQLPELIEDGFPAEVDKFKEYLQRILEERAEVQVGLIKGVNKLNFELVNALEEKRLSQQQLFCMVKALSLFVTSIDKLPFKSILELDWLNQNKEFIAVYIHLLQNVVSAHTHYIGMVFNNVSSNLHHAFILDCQRYTVFNFSTHKVPNDPDFFAF